MRLLILILSIILLTGCNAENSKECIQAKNRVVVYTDSLNRLFELYEGELETEEAERRISSMKGRIDIANYTVERDCSNK